MKAKETILSDKEICDIAASQHMREGKDKGVCDELVPIMETGSHYLIKCREVAEAQAGRTLTLIKEAGYVRLAEDQGLPDNLVWHKEDREFEAYCAGHNDILQAGWRKVEQEEQ